MMGEDGKEKAVGAPGSRDCRNYLEIISIKEKESGEEPMSQTYLVVFQEMSFIEQLTQQQRDV